MSLLRLMCGGSNKTDIKMEFMLKIWFKKNHDKDVGDTFFPYFIIFLTFDSNPC